MTNELDRDWYLSSDSIVASIEYAVEKNWIGDFFRGEKS